MRFLVLLLLAFSPKNLAAQTCSFLAYDGFDYPANQPLDDRAGGQGWLEKWSVQVDDQTLPGYQILNGNGSLNYLNLQIIGRRAIGGFQYLTAGRLLDNTAAGPFADYISDFENGVGSEFGTTLFCSFLLQKEVNNAQPVWAGLHESGGPWCSDCTPNKVLFGFFGPQSTVGGQKRWSLRLRDEVFVSPQNVVVGQPVFVVLKIQFAASGTAVEAFLNPTTLGNSTPATPTMSHSTAEKLQFRSLAAFLGEQPGNGSVDEIRLASSFACAAPDPSVLVNLPPVADFSMSVSSGISPLSVGFDASASMDPEGGPLVFEWNFGDGSGPQPGSAMQNHTFEPTGNLTVRLRVTDPTGLVGIAEKTLKITDSAGHFPCLTSFTSLRQPTCSGNDGRIRANDAPPVFDLFNAVGMALPKTNGQEWHGLAPGNFLFVGSSPTGCRDSFPLVLSRDSTTCAGWQPEKCRLEIGTNMSGFADWVPERPMRNLLKHIRPGLISFTDACFCWYNDLAHEIQVDANGYPTHIPQNTPSANGQKVRFFVSSEGANLVPGQTYVLLYDGIGDLEMAGSVQVLSETPGRIEFNSTGAGNTFFNVHQSQVGNHVRNVRLLRLADEFADLDAQPFYDGFLQKLEPFSLLRFMDWGHTNGNSLREWADRPQADFFTFGTEAGVPFETMIRLANQTKKDVWLCVPHAASDDFVEKMATLFRDELDPERTIYLEYSNEVWNWIFDQAHFNENSRPSNLNYGRNMARHAGRIFRIWHETFGPEKGRVKRVLGLQAGFNYLNEQILSQLDPSEWDFGSPTSYLGLDHGASGQPVLHAGSTPQNILENARSNWAGFRPSVRQDYRNVTLFGKKLVNYEGGQHFVGNVFGVPYPYQQAMWDAQYTPEIGQLYTEMLDTIRRWGSRMFGNFSLASPQESVYGSWGGLNDIDVQPPFSETAPKYQAVIDAACQPVSSSDEWPPFVIIKTGWLGIQPNPTTGPFWVNPPAETGTFELFDGLGRRVFRQVSTGLLPVEISVGEEAKGVFWLRFLSENGGPVWAERVVIH